VVPALPTLFVASAFRRKNKQRNFCAPHTARTRRIALRLRRVENRLLRCSVTTMIVTHLPNRGGW
jgi:hypothetical protein